jgi:hypothetical protein
VGPFLTSKHFLAILSRSKLGNIINVSSDWARIVDNNGENACYEQGRAELADEDGGDGLLEGAGRKCDKSGGASGVYPDDDLEESMRGLVHVLERFGQVGEEERSVDWSYVRRSGERIES